MSEKDRALPEQEQSVTLPFYLQYQNINLSQIPNIPTDRFYLDMDGFAPWEINAMLANLQDGQKVQDVFSIGTFESWRTLYDAEGNILYSPENGWTGDWTGNQPSWIGGLIPGSSDEHVLNFSSEAELDEWLSIVENQINYRMEHYESLDGVALANLDKLVSNAQSVQVDAAALADKIEAYQNDSLTFMTDGELAESRTFLNQLQAADSLGGVIWTDVFSKVDEADNSAVTSVKQHVAYPFFNGLRGAGVPVNILEHYPANTSFDIINKAIDNAAIFGFGSYVADPEHGKIEALYRENLRAQGFPQAFVPSAFSSLDISGGDDVDQASAPIPGGGGAPRAL